MIAANYSEFRSKMKDFLDKVEEDGETLILKRGTGKGTVIISLEEYNSIMETMHLLSSKTNATWLFDSIDQHKSGKSSEKSLIEE
ncbi:type II toxin-antitoxin system Phd/YefM family antitoxin [Algoriphagus antarcticus]|uniref:Antitoxin n=1 Tax=Algoriphagus antarcticus TaxID=238540 RepID=A0A3E0DZ84_9BACT|nr:type II toxin-antitoxin system prevent-host-death family antitoxin [Algoriphagus antarcticus]REG91404.1 antitoxin YefM [Algoriphagus antarcticus]